MIAPITTAVFTSEAEATTEGLGRTLGGELWRWRSPLFKRPRWS